jgi:asparagine synthase (glutamine-hydrolysing)
MSESLAHRGPDGDGVVIQRATALGYRYLRITPQSLGETQPVVRASGTTLVFDGRLDNREDVIAEVRGHRSISSDAPDADLAASCYDMHGAAFARRLAGDFAVAVFDARERHVVLARDAIGARPLYYRRHAASLTFASEIKALLADPALELRPNDRLLAELMLGQLHRQDDDGTTLFEGILAVPAAHVCVFSPARSVVQRYWDFDGRPAPGRSFDDYADGFRHQFRRAVERRLRSAHPVAIALSGGLDSSSIFCLASQSATDTPVVGITYTTRDGSPSDESTFVGEVERACGRSIQYIDPSFEGALFKSSDVIASAEMPLLDPQSFRSDRLLAAASMSGARTLITGDWGDQVLFDQAYLVDLIHAGSWRTVGAHLDEYRRWFPDASDEFRHRLIADLFDYDVPHWIRRAIRAARRRWHAREPWDDWYSQWFRREAGPDIFGRDSWNRANCRLQGRTALALALYREVRSRYHGLCLEWNNKTAAQYGIEFSVPFLDRDLVEFLMGVPGTILVHGGVPKALLRHALSGLVPAAVLQRRTKGDFTSDVNRATRHDLSAIRKLLESDPLVVQFGYVDPEKLKRGLRIIEAALHGSSSCVASWRLIGLVAFELWLRQFAGTRQNTKESADYGQTAGR